MKKICLLLIILLLNSNIALATNNNLVSSDWWKKATLEDVKDELSKGSNVNISGSDLTYDGNVRTNVTPLMFALRYNKPSPEIIELLINSGADVNAKNQIGLTPLVYAVQFNDNPEIVKRLIHYGANVNDRSNSGRTILMHAALGNNNPEIIKVLINAGADIGIKEKDGRTALMFAVQNENPEVVKTLIDARADMSVKDNQGGNAWGIGAINNKNPEVVKILNREVEKYYNKADYEDQIDFEANFEGCLSAEEYQQNVEDSMSAEMKFGMMLNPVDTMMRRSHRSKDCQCIFEVAQVYLGNTEFNNVMNAFRQGRRGSSKKALRKAIPAAFISCF